MVDRFRLTLRRFGYCLVLSLVCNVVISAGQGPAELRAGPHPTRASRHLQRTASV